MNAPIKLADSHVETELDGETVVMQIDTGDFFSLSGSAQAIWSLLDGTRDRQALIDLLCAQYGEDHQRVAADVDAFIAQLDAAGLLARG